MKVLLFGTFDLLHVGHFHLFKQAKFHGDKLIVVLARDERVKEIKGCLPIHTEKERKKILEQISIIDKVMLGDKHDVYKIIKKIAPDVIALGYDQRTFTGNLKKKLREFRLKAKVVRLKPYKEKKYKSEIIKKKLSKSIESL